MSAIEAILIGLIQGLTEFLPVSSSGHLVIAKELFGIESENIAFEVIVHAATVLSTIVVFWRQIWKLLSGLFKFKYNEETKYICMILVSMVPVFIVGVFFKDRIESLFTSGLPVVGLALIVTAFLLFFSEYKQSKSTTEAKPLSYKSAAWMGLAQAVAVIPGLSRSGSTIATGLICGVRKDEVAQFSFLMVLVPVLGETFLSLVGGDFSLEVSGIGAGAMILGFLSAFVAGLFACKVMIALVKKAKLRWFALYCAIVGVACLIWHILG
jgi:undecaprenyl-diphosphatase